MKRPLLLAMSAVLPLAALSAAAPQGPIALPGERLFPESVSITPKGIAYIGAATGGVMQVSLKTGRSQMWIEPGAGGTGSIFGVLPDRKNHILWACSNDLAAVGITVPGADSGAVLKGFDLATGKIRVSLPLPGAKSVCNDMAVAKDGSVLVTDTGHPQVLRWRPGSNALEVWASDPLFDAPRGGGLDGIAFGGDGNLYLNNFFSGDLYRIDVAPDGSAGKATKLRLSRPLAMPDGMRLVDGTDFALAEGAGRISRIAVAGDTAEVRTLAEGIAEPTGVSLYAGSIWYVQGQLGHFYNPVMLGKKPQPFNLTPVRLKP